MPRREKSSSELRGAALWLAAGVFELPVFAVLAGHGTMLGWRAAAAAHLAAAAVVFFVPPREKGWFLPTRHWGTPMALGTLIVPGFGWLAAGWLMVRNSDASDAKQAYRFDDEQEDLNPLATLGTPQSIRRDLADALEVLPAADALMSVDPALKRGAIETLSRIRTPESIAWILRARSDSDPETRFYATSALTRLKGEYETAIRAAEREVSLRPAEASLRLAVQHVRYEYAVSGVLDPVARGGLLEECRRAVEPSAARIPEWARLAYLVERALDPEAAFPALERLERLDAGRAGRWLRERVELCFSVGRLRE
ncbi:MAG: HEAT repeat domain-containing protein, partial [Elusimicrobia bacterium]|nr:HEAT repeat domain-containing protein [Elusimicrobiota bacterium]